MVFQCFRTISDFLGFCCVFHFSDFRGQARCAIYSPATSYIALGAILSSASISQADRIFQKEARPTARSILARIDRAASLFPVSDANRQLCHATLDDIGHGQTFEKNRHNAIYPGQDRSHLRSDILPQNAIYPRWARPRRSRLESDPSGGAGGWGVDRTLGGRQIWKKW